MEQNYKPNSRKSKMEQPSANGEKKEITKVISGKAIKKKKSSTDKIISSFISDDVKNIKSYVIDDVLIPTIKNAVYDIIANGADMFLFGEGGRRNKRHSGNSGRVGYGKYYDKPSSTRGSENRTRSGYSYDDIILETRGEAEDVLERMDEIIDQYEAVSVSDLYDLVGERSQHTDQKYGWENLRNAEVIRCRDGYMLKLPKALPIK